MDETFEEWIKGTILNPNFGYLYPKDYKPKYFNPEPVAKCMTGVVQKIKARTFCKEVDEMEDLKLILEVKQGQLNEQLIKDCYLLHGFLNKIVPSYLIQKEDENTPSDQIVLPRNVGIPLYKISQFLKIQLGPTTDFHFNWSLPSYDCSQRPPLDFQVDQVKMVEHFSSPLQSEDLFFGGSVLGAHYLFRAVKTLYQINQNISKNPLQSEKQNILLLKEVEKFINKIVKSNQFLLNNISHQLFNNNIFRRSFSGFKNLKFQGIQERLNTPGGAGGFDPSFQLFQSLMQIQFEGSLKTSQQAFQRGFPETLRNLMKNARQTFMIKEYCAQKPQLQQAYNGILKEYTNFYILHRQLIKKYVLTKNPNAKAGTAQVNLVDFMDRYQTLSQLTQRQRTEPRDTQNLKKSQEERADNTGRNKIQGPPADLNEMKNSI